MQFGNQIGFVLRERTWPGIGRGCIWISSIGIESLRIKRHEAELAIQQETIRIGTASYFIQILLHDDVSFDGFLEGVFDCRFVFDRPYNSYRPEGMARCERLELEVIAPGKNDLNLFDWYDKQGVQSGRIVISLAAEAKLTEQDAQIIYFEDAKCFSLSENYDINTSRRRTLKLAIEAETITVDDVLFQHI